MSRWRSPATRRGSAAVLALTAIVAACGHGLETPQLPTFDAFQISDPADVDAVVFLVGDAGATSATASPILVRLREDIERWSKALARDSAVSVIFLGDNVYPVGLHDRSSADYPQDSARLANQIALVTGPEAQAHRTAGWFVAGNHDWGNIAGEAGLHRLVNQSEALEHARERGANVILLPPAGVPGPVIRDVRDNVRIIFIDTHWMLTGPPFEQQTEFFDRIEDALRTAGARDVIIACHHPWETSGPHGTVEGGRGFGLYYLLEKSGALVQDLNSPAYKSFIRRFRERVDEVERPPLIWAAGHDHSLQVFAGEFEDDPVHILVSGAGSKLTPVSELKGLRYAAARPGYMMLVFRKDDTVNLFVVAGDPDHLECAEDDAATLSECMDEGVAAFETVYSERLREPAVDVRPEAEDSATAAARAAEDSAAAVAEDSATAADSTAADSTAADSTAADSTAADSTAGKGGERGDLP